YHLSARAAGAVARAIAANAVKPMLNFFIARPPDVSVPARDRTPGNARVSQAGPRRTPEAVEFEVRVERAGLYCKI
ncbi:MAG: hypothetical protein OXG98_19265, partial [Gemmatimonadetes bacterium]|nr:hypothetical protein [Gemmatimonadota bacterium]